MQKIAMTTLLLISTVGCGEGQWGAEIQVNMRSTAEGFDSLAPGDTLILPGDAYSLTVNRACVSVEAVVVTPEAGAAPEGGEDCFCHGDPPHCHGDCETLETAAERPISATVDIVVDLLSGPTTILSRGTSPGSYVKVAFAFSMAAEPLDLPAACADMEGRTFWVESTLTEISTGKTWSLTVDIRADDQISEAASAEPPALATPDRPAVLDVALRLDQVMAHVNLAAVTADASATVTIGGPDMQHPTEVDNIIDGLTEAASVAVAGSESP